MNIALTLLEQWGLYLLAGTIGLYFAWHIMAFLQTQHVSYRNDPILTVTTLGWGSIWLIGNGVGNTLFIFSVLQMIGTIVTYQTQTTLPALPGSEACVFLLGLMPSLYQFRYQSDPEYLETLPLSRRIIAITLTLADGVFCALGWYWWLLPPAFTQGQFDFPFDQSLVLGILGWGIFSSYIAQYMAHMQLFDLLGITPPTFPNPFLALWHSLRAPLAGTPPTRVAPHRHSVRRTKTKPARHPVMHEVQP